MAGFNHHPADHGIWVEYNGLRFKDVYHVELKSGLVCQFMYPNGNGWYPESGSNRERVDDKEVARVCLVTRAELESIGSWRACPDDERIGEQLALFDDIHIPEPKRNDAPEISLKGKLYVGKGNVYLGEGELRIGKRRD